MVVKTALLKSGSDWGADLRALGELDSPATVVFLFGSPSFQGEAAPFREIQRHFPRSTLFGCSTAGEIFRSHIVDNSLSLAAVRFEATTLRSASVRIESVEQSFAAGKQLFSALNKDGLRAVFVLSDGLRVNGSELLRGLSSGGHGKVITGGMAGDGVRFRETWVLKDGLPASGHVAGLGLYGDRVRIGHGSMSGWSKFGPDRIVTKSKGNVLYEVDGRPALQLYKEYLGEKAAGLPATALLFPMQISDKQDQEKRLVRTVVAVDEPTQSMTFAGDMPEGAHARLMMANLNSLVEGASSAAKEIADQPRPPAPSLTLAVSCFGRRLVLGERVEEELEAALEQLPPSTEMVGFYSYGEFSPVTKGRSCELHNQTMTLTLVSEESGA